MKDFISSVISFSKTMSDDNAHRLVEYDVPFYTCNLHCYTNAIKYGTGSVCDAIIYAEDIAWLENGNLIDLLFKNETAGSNGKIVAVLTVPIETVKKLLKMG